MKKVLIIGSCGAGKSSFARRLHSISGSKLVHLDSFYHKPNWEEPSEEEWLSVVNKLVEGEKWIMDGNFGGTMDLRSKYLADSPKSSSIRNN
jgi:adenylate kinase family enzyme